MLLREDSRGVIWRFVGTPEAPQERLYLDPSGAPHAPFANTLGSFPDSMTVTTPGLQRDEEVFVRGVAAIQHC
jgi:hypothetical protein